MKKYISVTDPNFKRDDGNAINKESAKLRAAGAKPTVVHLWEKPLVLVIKEKRKKKPKEAEDGTESSGDHQR
jgi:hypothetical protein